MLSCVCGGVWCSIVVISSFTFNDASGVLLPVHIESDVEIRRLLALHMFI